MNYIYCYTNKINQHKYVGQTNNLKRRIKEHYCCAYNSKSSSYNTLFHQKIREYGIDNFIIEVLEIIYDNSQDYVNDRERYWIKNKNSFRGNGQGYNSDLGGGCKISSKLSQNDIETIQQMLQKKAPFIDIETQYQISPGFLSGINHGVYFFDDKLNYPLCRYYKEDKDYDELINLLTSSDLRLSEIAKQLSIGYSTIKKINAGTLRHGLYPTYPIRKLTANEMRANKIKELLLSSEYSKTEISKMLHVDLETIRRINIGQSFYDNNLSYPLRSL